MGTAKRILDEAFAQLKWPSTHGITDAKIELERELDDVCDFLFSPSPMVTESLLTENVPKEKIFFSSYGWAPDRFVANTRAPRSDGFNVVFVGTLGVRKGIPWLLRAWKEAGVRGRLVLAGALEPEVKERCSDLLNQDNVVVLGNVADVGALFRTADLFTLPTWEEGSPLVTYEAMACGCPVLVSPMGAGGIVQHEQDGIIVEPGHHDAWVSQLRRLAHDRDLRLSIGKEAKKRAGDFTWSKVGQKRREQLLKCRLSWQAAEK